MVDPRVMIFSFVRKVTERCSFIDKHIVDKRNRVFVVFLFFITFGMIPSAFYLFYSFGYVHAILHVLAIVYLLGETFASMLHCTSHGSLFIYEWMEYFIPVVIIPFMGQTWCTYYHHHVKHHHVEGNGHNDLSSTKGYQRDSFSDFLIYFLRFYLLCWIELPIYFFKRGRYMYGIKVIWGEVGTNLFWGILGSWYGWRSAIFVFFVPMTILRFGMMAANWGQHAFVAAHEVSEEKKISPYTYSLTIQDSYYNTIAFNDGYHATHHVNGTKHWTSLPESFDKHCDEGKYVSDENAVILSGDVNFGDVWQLLMFKDYEKLADMYRSHSTGKAVDKMSQKELIQKFKELMKPM